MLALIHRGLLLNGGVEACDGTVKVHDALPLTIYQIGVSLVSYRGDQGTWHQRLFRRDVRQKGGDPVDEVLEVLERRAQRAALNHATPSDQLGGLGRRTVMEYGERAILLRRSQAVWRMGHGNPITYELLTGAGMLELMEAGTNVVRELVEAHQKFVFVASEPRACAADDRQRTASPTLRDRPNAGGPVAWLVPPAPVRGRGGSGTEMGRLADRGRGMDPALPRPRRLPGGRRRVPRMRWRRPTCFTPTWTTPHFAAHVALADSLFEEHRGFPLLIGWPITYAPPCSAAAWDT